MAYTDIIEITAPDSVSPGGTVNVEVLVRNKYTDNVHIYCVGLLGTSQRFIDYQEAWLMSYEAKVFSGSFVMPSGDDTINIFVYYEGDDGGLHSDTSASKSISVAGGEGQVEKWWITVAEGRTLDEIQVSAANAHAHGPFRMIISTNGAPDWVLQSGAWLFNALQGPLNVIGIGLTNVEVKGSQLYVYMHASPAALIPVIIVIGAVLAALGIIMLADHFVVQHEISYQLAVQLDLAKTQAEVATAAIAAGFPPKVVATIAKAMADLGSKPEPDVGKIDWETYLRWALIGGGVILGTYLLLPTIVNLRKR